MALSRQLSRSASSAEMTHRLLTVNDGVEQTVVEIGVVGRDNPQVVLRSLDRVVNLSADSL